MGNVLEEFYSGTAMNGISNASRARHPLRKLFWWVITLVAAVATAYVSSLSRDAAAATHRRWGQIGALSSCFLQGIYQEIARYLQYSVSTTLYVIQQKNLTFPAVTICNLSPFSCSRVMAHSGLEELAKVLF